MNDATSKATEIETLRAAIRIAEHNVDRAAPDYVAQGGWMGRSYYIVQPKRDAQASLDDLCRQLGQLTDDA
jgi:hypothetical protein